MRAGRPLRGACRLAAGKRQARSAGYRAVLCNTRCDDLLHQRPAMGRLQALRLERRRRVGLCRFLGRALTTREPSLSIPCFAERRYGGVLDDEMLMALSPDDIGKAIAGMEALAKNGLRYPFPQYGIQQDVRAGMAVSYPSRGG